MANVAVIGGSREVRLLIKGLLRLHHHIVVAEGPNFDALDAVPMDGEPPVVVVDFDLEEPGRIDTVRAARKAQPRAGSCCSRRAVAGPRCGRRRGRWARTP